MRFTPVRTSHEYSKPDTPWRKPDSRLLFEKGGWAVTEFGLEPLTHVQELWENYKIPGCELLAPALPAEKPWPDFDGFEDMFRKAIQVHACRSCRELRTTSPNCGARCRVNLPRFIADCLASSRSSRRT
jgi:hypothetical protein